MTREGARHLAPAVGLAVALCCTAAPALASGPDRPAVIGVERIGESVQGRAILAWHVGDPSASVTAVAMAVMHGDERAPRRILWSIRDGRPVQGLDLWLIPAMNPDGIARNTRQNADGVDLNRNFPYRWAQLTGATYSGPGPASEPETRAVMAFMRTVDPDYVVSFHQPLHAVDTSVKRVRPFARRLADALRLPPRRLLCGGVCHGTFTQWFNHRFAGQAVTVEYGAHPTRHRMDVVAPRQLIRVLGGHR